MGLVTQFVQSLLELPGRFVAVALHDPLSALLVLMGGLFIAISVGYFAYLAIGAVLSLVLPAARSGASHRP